MMALNEIVNFLLGWTLDLGFFLGGEKYGHFVGIIIISFLLTLLTTLVYKYFTDQEALKNIKEENKKLQDEMKVHKDNPQKMMELNREMMAHSMEMMKHSFKPMLITFIPIIIFFAYMRDLFVATEIAKSWIWWYIGASIVGSIIFRKLFKLP
jgi:uncharacterized membrane protein (DUF106 family)